MTMHAQTEYGKKALSVAHSLRIPAHDVRHICGGISDMTLWRWLNSEALNFPRPIYIGKRRYWREVDVIAWLDSQSAETAQ